MAIEKILKLTACLAFLGMAGFASTALAIPIVYSGYDPGSTTLASSPTATAAAAAFDLSTGPLSIIDFEGPLPSGVGLSGGVTGVDTDVCSTPALHCYATSPSNVYRNNGAPSPLRIQSIHSVRISLVGSLADKRST